MSSNFVEQREPLANLRKHWAGLAFLGSLILISGFLILKEFWQVDHALRWFSLALAGMAYLLWSVWGGLQDNHRVGEGIILGTFGAGTGLTISRGVLIATLAGFLLLPLPGGWLAWIPGSLYSLAVLLDYTDGYLARSRNHATRLGENLDMNLDGLGLFVATLLAVLYGQVPVWYLVVGLARYFFMAGSWLRKRQGKPVYDLGQSVSRRAFAGAQMGFIAVMLFPAFSPPGTHWAASLFALPFLAGFSIDWLVLSGHLAPSAAPENRKTGGFGAKTRRRPDALWRKAGQWAPLALRVLIVLLLAISLASRLQLSLPAQGSLVGASIDLVTPAAIAVVGLQIFGLLFLAVGAAGRTSAAAVLISIGIHQRLAELGLIDLGLIVCGVAIFFFGTGAFSLWSPEDQVIYRKPGETREVGSA